MQVIIIYKQAKYESLEGNCKSLWLSQKNCHNPILDPQKLFFKIHIQKSKKKKFKIQEYFRDTRR